ncbi:hypothetical protein AXK57_17450 [Tsukamurella pulmonis]|nr:hypothetical protein AXK57_17450 [Tsukamurella pulmonis]
MPQEHDARDERDDADRAAADEKEPAGEAAAAEDGPAADDAVGAAEPDREAEDGEDVDDETSAGARPAPSSRRTARPAAERTTRAAAKTPRARPAAPARETRRAPSGTLRTVLATVVVIALVVVSVLLYLQTRTLGTERRATADQARAEQIASDYAVRVATMDYRDLTPWLNSVKEGATPELGKKFEGVADLLREIATPLRLVTTGKASFAKTTSEVNGLYEVKVAVELSIQNIQAPQGSINTTIYSVSMDRNRDWVITASGENANPSGIPGGLGGAPAATGSAPAGPPPTPTMPELPAPSTAPN